jgi:hypothetical protein
VIVLNPNCIGIIRGTLPIAQAIPDQSHPKLWEKDSLSVPLRLECPPGFMFWKLGSV